MPLTLPRQIPTTVTQTERSLFQRLYDLRDYVLAKLLRLQVNGNDNGSQTLLNLVAGSNVTITDGGQGDVTIASTGGGGGVPTSRRIDTTAPLTGGGDLTANRTLAISNFIGDSGSGGSKGSVPAPGAGDGSTKFLKADGTWAVPSGGGTTLYWGQDDKVAGSWSNTITLASTPVTNSPVVFVNGTRVSYTASGAVLTIAWVAPGADVGVVWATTNATPGSFSLSAVGAPWPTLRGTAIQAAIASSYTLTLPAGTSAGDRAVIVFGHGFDPVAPGGWTTLDINSGNAWNGAVFTKLLSSGDISTGSVTVTASGSYSGVAGLIVFQGGTAGIRETDHSTASGTSQSITTSGALVNTDTAIYWGTDRDNAVTITPSRGSLQQTATTGSGTGAIYTEAPVPGGAETVTFSYSSGASNYQAIVVVKGV
jgi:hypothetical protein